MNTKHIQLNGQLYFLGNPAISLGLDTNGKTVICNCQVLEDGNGELFLKDIDAEIDTVLHPEDMDTIYPDTPENRIILSQKANIENKHLQ